MNKLISFLNRYMTKYLSTRVVFLVDMIMSVMATVGAILLVKFLIQDDIFEVYTSMTWISLTAVFSFFGIWILRT